MTEALRTQINSLVAQRRSLLGDLTRNPSGLSWCEAHTALIDDAVKAVASSVRREVGTLPFAVVATGGYGRRELCPFSDVDVAVIPWDEHPEQLDGPVRLFFRRLHEAVSGPFGLNLGYAFLLISDVAGIDLKTRTGLLDARLVEGPLETMTRLNEAFIDSFPVGEFLIQKIREREEAFVKTHDSPLVVEPHLKEGAGGLRCFQTASWLRMAIGEQPPRKSKAYSLVTRYRNLLHAVSGKCHDHLTRHRRDEIAQVIGVDPFRLNSDLAAATDELHQAYLAARERLLEARFEIAPGVVALRGEARVVGDADPGEAAVGVALATELGLRVEPMPPAKSAVTKGPAAAYALSRGEATIRNLDRARLLERLLPELTACRTLVSQDHAHTYTVFEHTLRAVRNLETLPERTFLRELRDSLQDLQPLMLAALLHDVGKITEDEPHSEVGARMARDLANRWELGEDRAELIEWLVREHLTMARFVRLRDIENPETAREFAKIVGTAERLDMLTLLTWADVNAVSSSAWTLAQVAFLRQLHQQTLAILESDPQAPDESVYRRRLLRGLQELDVPDEEVQAFIDSLPAHYLTSTPPSLVRLHYRLAERAREGETTVEIHHQPELGATDFTVCTPDAPGLLSRILGVLYAFDLTLLGVRASTTASQPSVALDVVTVSFGGRPVPPATSTQVTRQLRAVLSGERAVSEVLKERGKEAHRAQRFFTYTFVEGSPSVLEIRAPRGRGMPYRFSRLFAEKGWNILAARAGQWAGNGAAAFYLLGRGDRPLTREEVDAALADAQSA